VAADPVTGQTSVEWLFAGGDVGGGPASVVDAIAAGERAAVGIDRYLTGENHAFWRDYREVDTFFDPDAEPMPFPRARVKLLDANQRKGSFQEIEIPWPEAVARREAGRCLRCDYRAPER
jgi:NADH-quinone oxidoreductase subunit F